MSVTVLLQPPGAALGSSVRFVGTGMTGIAAVTVGGATAAFTVTGGTDLVVHIPATGVTPADDFGNTDIVADGVTIATIITGHPGKWRTPPTVTGQSVGPTSGGVFTGLDATFAGALSPLTFDDYTLDIPATVGLIAPDTTDNVPSGHDLHNGQWELAQLVAPFNVARGLLEHIVAGWASSLILPTGALGVEVNLTAADLDAAVSGLTLIHEWDNVTHPGAGFYPFSGDGVAPVEVRLVDGWSGADPVGQTSPSSLTLLASVSLTDPGPVTGTVDVSGDLTDVGYGAYYHAGGLEVVGVTGPESTGVEPSWPVVGSFKSGWIAATLLVSLAFTWRPPQWRPLFAAPQVLPPLRYYPRDDAVGGAPRTNRSSTSRQSSARQGWTNTYR